MSFNRQNLREIRNTMIKEMEEVAKKYGYEASFGNIRFSADEFDTRLTVKSKNAVVAPVITSAFNGKLKVGSLINHPARKEPLTVTEITSRGSVKVTSARGAKYRLKMEDALRYAA